MRTYFSFPCPSPAGPRCGTLVHKLRRYQKGKVSGKRVINLLLRVLIVVLFPSHLLLAMLEETDSGKKRREGIFLPSIDILDEEKKLKNELQKKIRVYDFALFRLFSPLSYKYIHPLSLSSSLSPPPPTLSPTRLLSSTYVHKPPLPPSRFLSLPPPSLGINHNRSVGLASFPLHPQSRTCALNDGWANRLPAAAAVAAAVALLACHICPSARRHFILH